MECAAVKAEAMALEDAMAWEKEYQIDAEFVTDGQDIALDNDSETSIGSNLGIDDEISVEHHNIHGNGDENNTPINQTILSNFKQYVALKTNNPIPLTDIEVKAINLLALLRKTKASLETYDMVMEWHLKSSGLLKDWQSLGSSFSYLTHQKVFTTLRS